ncbi:MAG: 4a-hydroxytetrahydrobiopterin dehydratase [Deinococcus sp.]|nr:4a-hydroxytetrahydrobiopterin dehydratase [Deinococcus sp.]
MSELSNLKCTACRGDEPPLDLAVVRTRLSQLPGWRLEIRDQIPRLEKEYRFKNFAEALQFTDHVGRIAEEEGHHPAILTEWGKVTVSWWTHKIKGVHQNDLIMAAKTDDVYKGS